MAASQIAAGVNRELAKRSDEESGGDAAELFTAAFDGVVGKMPESRREPLREAFAAVREELSGLPVARTEPFFDGPEAEAKGSGELFVLALDPDACKGCGVCVAECAPEALAAVADDPVRIRDARGLWRIAEELPEPPSGTVERARNHPEVGSLAGATLPKAARETVAAADGADAGSGSSLAVRQALATAAFHLAPLRAERLAALDAVREELAAAIHEGLARALPDRDLDALAEGLGALERPEADLAELTGRVERALEGDRVDVARLRRLVDTARGLADLRVRVGGTDGSSGDGPDARKGRPAPAPFGLVLGGRAAAWGGAFPYTPFAVPVTVDATGDGAGIARGLLEGSLDDALAVARAVRRARIELAATTPSEAARAAEQVRALEDLGWRDLEPAERALCPPVFLVAGEDDLLHGDLAGLAELLADDLPVKAVLLSDGWAGSGLGPDPVLAWAGQSATLGALIAQTSVGAPDHLERAVAGALAFDGPALVRIHAPEPAGHGFPASATLERARSAVACRVHPLFVSRPASGEDATAGSAGPPVVDLSGNPEPEAGWVREGDGGDGARLTPAHWALGEERFAGDFGAPLDPEDPRPRSGSRRLETLPLADYLELGLGEDGEDGDEREGKVPVVEEPSGALRPVAPALVRAAERRLGAWRLLQRWASADEAFATAAAATEQRERLERMEEEHRREVEALRADYEQRLAEARATTQAEMARRVREKLLALAVRKAGGEATETPGNGVSE
jgi:pyruvate-ferredoxin/flavodoxin oxidoreductase